MVILRNVKVFIKVYIRDLARLHKRRGQLFQTQEPQEDFQTYHMLIDVGLKLVRPSHTQNETAVNSLRERTTELIILTADPYHHQRVGTPYFVR